MKKLLHAVLNKETVTYVFFGGMTTLVNLVVFKVFDLFFAGKWYLSSDTEIDGLEEVFPDIYAFGNELEIMPDGRISWHIGAAGAAGTYEVYGNQLVAGVADIMEDDETKIALTLKDGELMMKYKGVPLIFTR